MNLAHFYFISLFCIRTMDGIAIHCKEANLGYFVTSSYGNVLVSELCHFEKLDSLFT